MSANQRRRHHRNSGAAPSDDSGMAWIAVGEVVGAFGIHGEIKVLPLTDFPDRFARTPTLYLGDARAPHAVQSARPHQRIVLVKLDGIDEVAVAERLRGVTLWIPEAERMPLDAGKFYLHDVVGLRVFHVNGQPLGEVVNFITGSGNDLFVVRATPSGREVLLPAVRAFVHEMDISAGVLRVDPIPGLFDDQAENAGDTDTPNALAPADESDDAADATDSTHPTDTSDASDS